MQHRALFGWVLAAGFCASVSCGGGNSGNGPPGFGVTCTADKDCAAFDLLCGVDTCVQCLDDGDCKSTETCSAGLCKVPEECEASGDCSGKQVCDEQAGVCVECLENGDCKSGQGCSDHHCVDRPVCEFTSDCNGGLVCDTKAGFCVDCRTDDDCGFKRVCDDNECVTPPTSGGGGSGGKAGGGAGGKASGGSPNGGTATMGGRTTTGGLGGSAGMAGSLNEGGAGEGGAGPSDCGCVGTEVCTPDLRCVSPRLLDDLLDCDDQILSIEGRQGDWAAAADTGVNLMHGFTDPGSAWTDHSCAAWATGGEISLNNPNTTFAFIGFRLNVDATDQALPYDLSAYTGIQLKLESSSSVQVVLKTTGGGYFQVTLTPITPGSYTRTAPFYSMAKMANSLENLPIKLDTVTEIQFSVTNPKAFGLAVHRVELY